MKSNRKAANEEPVCDVFCDSLFRFCFAARYRERGVDIQTSSIDMLSNLVRGRSCRGCAVCGDRGYGSLKLVEEFALRSCGSAFIMPNHLPWCHPFIAASQLKAEKLKVKERKKRARERLGIQEDMSDDDDEEPDEPAAVPRSSANKFVIDDDPHLGLGVSMASKFFRVEGQGQENAIKVDAYIVRDRSSTRETKTHRFLISRELSDERGNENGLSGKWVASFYAESKTAKRTLFYPVPSSGWSPSARRIAAEEALVTAGAFVITAGQRCADWFIGRAFRWTGTFGARFLKKDPRTREFIYQDMSIIDDDDGEFISDALIWSKSINSWFGGFKASPAMAMGTKNEVYSIELLFWFNSNESQLY